MLSELKRRAFPPHRCLHIISVDMDWQSQYGDDVWAEILLDLEESGVHENIDTWRFFSPSLDALPDLEESGDYDGLPWIASPSQRYSAVQGNIDEPHDLLDVAAGEANPEADDVLLHSSMFQSYFLVGSVKMGLPLL